MLSAVFAAGAILAVILLAELLHHKHLLSGEFSRKFAHIVCGVIIAFLPFWVPYRWVAVLAVGFIIVNLFNHYYSRFRVHVEQVNHNGIRVILRAVQIVSGSNAIQSVHRRTWGEILFGVAILICALIRPTPWLFAAAILQVALADGLAAVVGVSVGKHHGYHYSMFSASKTFIGTWTFVLVSFVILAVVLVCDPGFAYVTDLWPILIWGPLLLAGVENLGIYGLDNILLPLVTLLMLSALQLA